MLSEYSRVNWQDADSTATPVNAENLNNMDAQIEAATNAIRSLEETGVSPEAIIAAVNDYLDEHNLPFTYATPEQYGAKGDGETDDTDAINACLAENNVVVFRGNYLIDTIKNGGENVNGSYGVDVPSNRILKFINGAKFTCIPNTSCIYCAVRIKNANNVVIDGMELQADRSNEVFLKWRKINTGGYSNISTDQGNGVFIAGSKNITLKNCEIYNALADGVTIWSTGNDHTQGSDFVISENINILNCKIHNNRRDGITIGSSKNVYVANSEMNSNGLEKKYENNSSYPVPYVDPSDSGYAENSYIKEGLVANQDETIVTASGIPHMCGVNIEPNYENNPVEDVTFENCKFLDNGKYGFIDTRATSWDTSHHCKIKHINCTANTYCLFANGDFVVIGGNYKKLGVGSLPSKGIVSGAVLNGINSSVLDRGKVFFNGCQIKGLLGTAGETSTISASADNNQVNAWVELQSCSIDNCVPWAGYRKGFFVLDGCYVQQPANSTSRLIETGHIIAENTEFHFENRASTETSVFKVTSAEFRNCDFYYPEDYEVENNGVVQTIRIKISLFSLVSSYNSESYTSFHRITNWIGNRFHNVLGSISDFNPIKNNLINNWFNFSKDKLTLGTGVTIVRKGNVWSDLNENQPTIDSAHKLSSDLVDDTSNTNKFVTEADKTAWGAKYDKPSGGIPSTDLSSAVQTSLGKADSSVQPADVYLKSQLSTKTLSVTDGSTTTNYSVLVVNSQ